MKVKDWDTWQTFRKDRGAPPWIKVHRNLMTNPKWAALTDAEKGQLVSLWIAAADTDGVLPDDPKVLRKICQLDNEPDIKKFLALGLMVATCQPVDNQLTTTCPQLDAPEQSRAEESRVDKSRIDILPRKAQPNKGTRLTKDWVLPNDWHQWAIEHFASLHVEPDEGEIERQADSFKDYWVSRSGAQATKLDWEATWRNWFRRYADGESKRIQRQIQLDEQRRQRFS